jgi:hypothetical protein
VAFTQGAWVSWCEFVAGPNDRDSIVTTPEQLAAMVAALQDAKVVAWDYETSGLSWWATARPCGVSFACILDGVSKAWYVPFRHSRPGVQLPPEKVLAAQQTILGDPKITKVAHNSKFERHMARVDGLRVRGEVVDTMVAAHLYKSTELIGLKERLIADVGDHAAAELKDTLQQDIRRLAKWRGLGVKAYRASYGYTELDQWLIQPYGCADALGALKLFNHYDSIGVRSYYSKPRRGPQYLSLWETEMALTEVFSHMEHIGQPLDLDYLKHLHVYMEMEKEKAEAAFFSTFNVQKFNLGSDDEIRQFLQKGLKVRLVKKTNKGAMAVDADVLLDLESSYPGLGHLLRWKDCEKKASTYTIALAARADQHGILHADFQSVGTVTGRVSCKEPNLQNVASDDAARAKAAGGVDPESIKRAFVVPRKTADPYMQWVQKHRGPGVQLVRQFWDLSQVELRVIAHYTREPRMLQAMAEASSVDFAPIDEESAGRHTENRTCFCMVRFGNVLGSSGSVVPLFRKQIAAGGPVTLTHADITRYFMTIPEAAQLVIQAGSMGQGGEVYVLDMGKPVKIMDLARRMVHLSGLEVRDERHPDGDIAIEIVGLRPGEKLFEELLIGENVEGTSHPLIMRAYEHELPWARINELLAKMDEASRTFDYERVLALLGSLVEEYSPARHGDDELWWRTPGRPVAGEVVIH